MLSAPCLQVLSLPLQIDTLGSDAQHGSVAAATADSVESAKGVLVTVNGEGVSEVGDVDESASNFQTLSIEWAS